MITECQSNS